MSNDLPIFRVASAMARHAAARHETLARNIANADTPGYKAKDIPPFDAVMAMQDDVKPADLRAELMRGVETSPNGNSVSLEKQVLLASQTQMQHQTAIGIYRKTMDLLRLGLGRRS